ncbi:Pyrrolidone-carboxylate peptidase [compost metagenome]
MNSSKILVTGFKPFRNEPINPSEKIVEMLSARHDVDTLVLPVTFMGSFEVLKKHLEANGPYKALMMIGQAAGRKAMSLERVALNWCESRYADEEQYRPDLQKPLVSGAPSSYISDFFPTQWAEDLSKIAPTSVSFTAGTYVCNALYFQTLHYLKNSSPALFVHVPMLPEQVLDKPGMDSMPLLLQFQVIDELVDKLLDLP